MSETPAIVASPPNKTPADTGRETRRGATVIRKGRCRIGRIAGRPVLIVALPAWGPALRGTGWTALAVLVPLWVFWPIAAGLGVLDNHVDAEWVYMIGWATMYGFPVGLGVAILPQPASRFWRVPWATAFTAVECTLLGCWLILLGEWDLLPF